MDVSGLGQVTGVPHLTQPLWKATTLHEEAKIQETSAGPGLTSTSQAMVQRSALPS